MKLQSLFVGSLLIVAGGLAACSPGNSVSVPTCQTPGCVPAGTVTTTPQTPTPGLTAPPNAVVVAIGSGTVTVTPPPALGFPAGTTVTFNGSNGGGPVYVTPFSTTAPAGATIPTGSTFIGTTSIYNPSTGTGFSATSATVTLPLPTGTTVAAGSSCVIAVQPNGTGTAITTPATLSGNTLTATIAPAGGLGIAPGFFDVIYAYCTPPGSGGGGGGPTASPTPLPNSTPVAVTAGTQVTFSGQGLPAGSQITLTPAQSGTINVGTFSLTAPTTAPAGTAGQTFAGQQSFQNQGGSAISTTGTGSLTLALPSTVFPGYVCTLYSQVPQVNGGAAQSTGVTAVAANATNGGTQATFTIPSGSTIGAGTTVTLLTYCTAPATPAALASPTALPVVAGVPQAPAPNVTGAPAGTTSSGNLSVPVGSTGAYALTAATINGTTGAITATPAPTAIGIPVYDGTTSTATSAFGGTPVAYGSFLFTGSSAVPANSPSGPRGGSSNIVVTVPNLNQYATTNPTQNYVLVPYDPVSGKYQTASVNNPYTGSQTTPTITATTNAGAGGAGTPASEVSSNGSTTYATSTVTQFSPGVTYGYVIVAK